MTKITYLMVFAVLIGGNESYSSFSSCVARQSSNKRSTLTDNLYGEELDQRGRKIRHPTWTKANFGTDISDVTSGQYFGNIRGLHSHSRIFVNRGPKRGEFVSQDPKYLLDDTSSYRQAIDSLQHMLKGIQSGSLNSVFSNAPEGQKMKNWRWRRFGRNAKNGKGYLDYTNSQMPFNEGTKRNPKEKNEEKEEAEMRKDATSNYSRVRRFLEAERLRKDMKGGTTLESKEAAMSRILDPNLNLDGILEPHVRKRRRRSLPRKNTLEPY